MDRMASMAVFTKVVGAGGFSAAAREMQVSQALVTKQISRSVLMGDRKPASRSQPLRAHLLKYAGQDLQ